MALAAAVVLGTAAGANAGGAGHGYYYVSSGYKITVSCYRGPWKEVIWDRPNPVFIDSLIAAGYDYPTATAVAERICRDPSLVGNPERLRETARAVLNGY